MRRHSACRNASPRYRSCAMTFAAHLLLVLFVVPLAHGAARRLTQAQHPTSCVLPNATLVCAGNMACPYSGWCKTSCRDRALELATTLVLCGNGVCDGDETCRGCAQDCGVCQPHHLNHTSKCVHDKHYLLTFDDGPTDVYVFCLVSLEVVASSSGNLPLGCRRTASLLDVLQTKNAPAAFFVLGTQLDGANAARRAVLTRCA